MDKSSLPIDIVTNDKAEEEMAGSDDRDQQVFDGDLKFSQEDYDIGEYDEEMGNKSPDGGFEIGNSGGPEDHIGGATDFRGDFDGHDEQTNYSLCVRNSSNNQRARNGSEMGGERGGNVQENERLPSKQPRKRKAAGKEEKDKASASNSTPRKRARGASKPSEQLARPDETGLVQIKPTRNRGGARANNGRSVQIAILRNMEICIGLITNKETNRQSFSANLKSINFTALSREISEKRGVACFSLPAFMICAKQKLTCCGLFKDVEKDTISVKTLEPVLYLETFIQNPEWTVSEEKMKTLKRMWYKVPKKYFNEIDSLRVEKARLSNINERDAAFTMILTRVYQTKIKDKESGKDVVLFIPVLRFEN